MTQQYSDSPAFPHLELLTCKAKIDPIVAAFPVKTFFLVLNNLRVVHLNHSVLPLQRRAGYGVLFKKHVDCPETAAIGKLP